MGHWCSDCTFVADTGTLLTLRDKASHKPEFVGKFTMSGWTGHSGFYLFKCPDCEDICVDYPHGYCENGCLYIRCDRCQFRIVFYPGQYKDVYKRENVIAPLTFWEELKCLWRDRKELKAIRKNAIAEAEAVEEMGVRVVEDADDLF